MPDVSGLVRTFQSLQWLEETECSSDRNANGFLFLSQQNDDNNNNYEKKG